MHWAIAITLSWPSLPGPTVPGPIAPRPSQEAPADGSGPQDAAPQRDFFEKRVRPLIAEHCASCHGPSRVRGGLRLDHGRAVRAGGDGGAIVVPGEPDASRLVQAVRYDDVDLRMPPRGRLADEEVAVLEEWVRRGAWWPPESEEAVAEGPAEQFDLAARREEHWVWRPIEDHPVPSVQDESWARDSVDRFLQARLDEAGLQPAEDASDRAWLRRVHFDLIGLPPTPEQIADYLGDGSEDRDARVVARLLASPHFGERWGRHWLDLVRYAESYGHEFDYSIPEPWRYRDYVVRGLNEDVSYDLWLKEHLAGDLLEEPRRHPRDGTDESILGTGFWHFHQATHAPVDIRQDEAERVDNQIDVMSKAFLGVTVSCARCHDHKFDAISTKDFYALAGYLQSSRREMCYLDPGGKIAAGVEELEAMREEARPHLAALTGPLATDLSVIDQYLLGAQELRDAAPTAQGVAHEGEDLPERERNGGRRSRQDMAGFVGDWSGDGQLFWQDAKPGKKLGLGVEVPSTGRYSIALHVTKAHDYGVFRVRLDGEVLLEELDLYNPEVIPGVVALGERALDAGERRLKFECVGKNPAAAPLHLLGIDLVVLSPADPDAEGKRAAARREVASRRELDPARLDRWAGALGDPGLRDAGHPMSAFLQLAPLGDAAAFDAKVEQLWAEAQEQAPAEGDVLFEDFENGIEGWSRRGEAFATAEAGTWDAVRARQPGREFARSRGGAAHSGTLSPRLQGSLRSKTFTIEKKHIHYKVRGDGGQIRVIIDGYFMDTYNALLFGGVSFDVRGRDHYGWHDQRGDVAKFIGHRAHIEILDHGDGWIAVDEIRFSDEGPRQRDARAMTLAVMQKVRELRASAAPPREALALAYAAVALETAGDGSRDPQAERFLEWCNGHGLLPSVEAQRSALADLAQRMHERDNQIPHPAKSLCMGDGTAEDEYVFIRGNHKLRGDVVPRRPPEALGGTALPTPSQGSGRLDLAEHLLRDDNPLVARVAVNRVWHHLFGRGIVPTPDDLGVLGQEPSHPELLDHLAQWFRTEAGWSRKALIERLVLTRAYRMSSALRPRPIEQKDPRNQLLHRMRVKRLEGEVLRDSLLAISGRLDPKLGGPSVPVHLSSFMQGRGRPGSGPLDGNGRRSIYLAIRRNFISPMMLAFDAPLPHSTVGRRTVSNVPAQALILMNDPFVHEQARRWSQRLLERSRDPAVLVAAAYEQAFARAPSESEAAQAMAYLADATEAGDEGLERGMADLCHVLFNVKEFVFVP